MLTLQTEKKLFKSELKKKKRGRQREREERERKREIPMDKPRSIDGRTKCTVKKLNIGHTFSADIFRIVLISLLAGYRLFMTLQKKKRK